MNKLRLAFLVTGIALIFILVYFLFFYSNSHLNPTNGGQNAINIVYSGCNSCSNSSIGIIYSLFNSANSFITGKNISFDTPEGTSLVSNYSITTLPSVIINETNKSEKILDSLVYLNIFNVEENNFVLNTPFLAGVAKGVTYFDLIQNRTVTAFELETIFLFTDKNLTPTLKIFRYTKLSSIFSDLFVSLIITEGRAVIE